MQPPPLLQQTDHHAYQASVDDWLAPRAPNTCLAMCSCYVRLEAALYVGQFIFGIWVDRTYRPKNITGFI
jgi:hypothetical protein